MAIVAGIARRQQMTSALDRTFKREGLSVDTLLELAFIKRHWHGDIDLMHLKDSREPRLRIRRSPKISACGEQNDHTHRGGNTNQDLFHHSHLVSHTAPPRRVVLPH